MIFYTLSNTKLCGHHWKNMYAEVVIFWGRVVRLRIASYTTLWLPNWEIKHWRSFWRFCVHIYCRKLKKNWKRLCWETLLQKSWLWLKLCKIVSMETQIIFVVAGVKRILPLIIKEIKLSLSNISNSNNIFLISDFFIITWYNDNY